MKVPEEYPEILNPHQVAELLDLSVANVLRMLRNGTLPGRKIGKKWRISKRQLIAYVERQGDEEDEAP